MCISPRLPSCQVCLCVTVVQMSYLFAGSNVNCGDLYSMVSLYLYIVHVVSMR